MKQSKPKEYKASYLKDLQKPDIQGFYDNWFAKIPWINAPQLKENISIQN